MQYKLSLLVIGFLFLVGQKSYAQELNCEVVVSYENIKQTDPSVFRTLEQRIREFFNETAFTNDKFNENERIQCSFYLNITDETDLNKYRATATINSTRPVYNSSYTTTLLDVIDKDFEFEFDPYTQLQYRENDFANNLTSSLAFYAYTIIGLDYDSFQQNGGRQYFRKAQDIVQLASSSGFPGWTQSSTNNGGNVSKFWISNNLTESKYSILHSMLYEYHRNGLDQLYDDPRKAHESITKLIENLNKFHKQNRNMAMMYLFFDAKAEEIVNIMKEASVTNRQAVAESAMAIDPLNNKLYKTLLN